jgi:hypothetical protein
MGDDRNKRVAAFSNERDYWKFVIYCLEGTIYDYRLKKYV